MNIYTCGCIYARGVPESLLVYFSTAYVSGQRISDSELEALIGNCALRVQGSSSRTFLVRSTDKVPASALTQGRAD